MITFAFVDGASVGTKRHPKPIGYEDISVTEVAVIYSLTKSLARKCVGALINFENGPFRVRMDGGQPQENVSGYLRSAGDEYFLSRDEAIALSVVLDTIAGGVNGALRVTYYG